MNKRSTRAKAIHIAHPDGSNPVPALLFVAQGSATDLDGRPLIGALIGKCGRLIISKTYPQTPCPYWAIPFENVKPGAYKLVVFEPRSGTREEIGVTVEAHHGLSISYPANNSNVLTTFVTYGTAEYNDATILATMSKGGNQFGNPASVQQPSVNPPSHAWSIRFNNVPVDTGYTLEVDPAVSATATRTVNVV